MSRTARWVRQRAAYLFLAAGLIGAVALQQHNNNQQVANVRHAACEATNRATHKVVVVVDTLAADTKYPKGASPALRTAIDNANKQRKAARELTERLLAPEDC